MFYPVNDIVINTDDVCSFQKIDSYQSSYKTIHLIKFVLKNSICIETEYRDKEIRDNDFDQLLKDATKENHES